MTKKMKDLSYEELREVFDYCPETGLFWWKKKPCRQISVGDTAGHKNKATGYVEIRYRGKLYLAHRLAWFYMTGDIPVEVDHRNLNRSDNSFLNLRNVTHAKNMMNTKIRKNNTTGVKGVTWGLNKRYKAQVGFCGKVYHCGEYDDLEEARLAVERKRDSLHREYSRHD